MASPHVAGTAALVIGSGIADANGDGRINDDVRLRLQQTADDLGKTGKDEWYGYGLVDADGAAPAPADAPPSVTIVSPAKGSVVSGTITVQANITDDRGVAGATFAVDNGPANPMSFNTATGYWEGSWNTGAVPDGSHTVSVTGTDNAGQTATASVAVTVDNVDGAPSAAIVNPANGSTVSGTVTVQVNASDDRDATGTLRVEVSIDGGAFVTATYNSTSGYYEYSWNTTAYADGTHTIDARAADSGGNITNAARVSVTVNNSPPPPGLTVTVSTEKGTYQHGEQVIITVTVLDGTDKVRGAAVHVELITANGNKLVGDGTTNNDGYVKFSYTVNANRDGVGTYTVNATASKDGKTGSGSTTFNVVKGGQGSAKGSAGGTSSGAIALTQPGNGRAMTKPAVGAIPETSLSQNAPNPFNPATTISYSLSEPGYVVLRIYNLLGQEVRTLVDEVQAAGSYTVRWDGKDNREVAVVSGIYLYQLRIDAQLVGVRRMILAK
jgi:flagellar hook assembly protein FlgD